MTLKKLANSVGARTEREDVADPGKGLLQGPSEGHLDKQNARVSHPGAIGIALPGLGRKLEANRGMQTTAALAKSGRIFALDFTKGALVLIMVLYHWINYFIGPDWTYYRYLRFLTPSFILVTGFLISNVYLSKYKATGWRLSKRLLTRGLKLLVLFAILNLARIALLPKLSGAGFAAERINLKSISDAFAAGNVYTGGAKTVAFYILIPIGYLLIISAGLVIPYRLYKYSFHAVSVLFLMCILVLGVNGLKSDNLEFITIGFLGVLIGFVNIEKINKLVSHPYMIAIAYGCYMIAITIWNVPFSLQIVGAFLSVGAIYLVGLRGNNRKGVRRHVILLGQYSLFGYVAQIAILQLLSSGFRYLHIGQGTLGISFVAAFALTMVAVESVDRARERSMVVDGVYKVIFA